MRAFAYTLLGLIVCAGLFLWGWETWITQQLRKFRNERPNKPWF